MGWRLASKNDLGREFIMAFPSQMGALKKGGRKRTGGSIKQNNFICWLAGDTAQEFLMPKAHQGSHLVADLLGRDSLVLWC